LLGALNSPGTFVPTAITALTPHIIGNTLTAGLVYDCEVGYPDFNESKLVVLWGSNFTSSFPAIGKQLLEAHQQGTKLLVINPRYTELAARADMWLQPRPRYGCCPGSGDDKYYLPGRAV